jgi:hypothetical protein
MVKGQKSKQVIPIDAYRQPRTEVAGRLTSQIRSGEWYGNFAWKDWGKLLAQLKNEMFEIDRAILALTKLAIERREPLLDETSEPERKQGRR